MAADPRQWSRRRPDAGDSGGRARPHVGGADDGGGSAQAHGGGHASARVELAAAGGTSTVALRGISGKENRGRGCSSCWFAFLVMEKREEGEIS